MLYGGRPTLWVSLYIFRVAVFFRSGNVYFGVAISKFRSDNAYLGVAMHISERQCLFQSSNAYLGVATHNFKVAIRYFGPQYIFQGGDIYFGSARNISSAKKYFGASCSFFSYELQRPNFRSGHCIFKTYANEQAGSMTTRATRTA